MPPISPMPSYLMAWELNLLLLAIKSPAFQPIRLNSALNMNYFITFSSAVIYNMYPANMHGVMTLTVAHKSLIMPLLTSTRAMLLIKTWNSLPRAKTSSITTMFLLANWDKTFSTTITPPNFRAQALLQPAMQAFVCIGIKSLFKA